jgi:hypothetical protein
MAWLSTGRSEDKKFADSLWITWISFMLVVLWDIYPQGWMKFDALISLILN